MIENIKNRLSQIKLTEIFDTFTKSKGIPTKPLIDNSKVLIEILDKISDKEYKILVNGKLFISDLPDNFKKGDILLSKILKSNPLTLSLVNLLEFSEINDKQKISILLQNLKIPITETSLSLLKSFIKNKTPILKEKFERLLKMILDSGLIFDEEQLDIIVKLFVLGAGNKFKFNYDTLKLFSEKEDQLYANLLNDIIKLNSISKNDVIKRFINEFLIINLDEKNNSLALFDKIKLVLIIDELMKEKSLSEYYDYLNALKFTLLKIVLRNRYLKYISRKQDFMIVRCGKNLNLIKYHYEAVNPEKLQGVDRVIIYFKTKLLGRIDADLLLNFDRLFIKFISNEQTLEKIDKNRVVFEQKLNKKYRLDTKITLYNPVLFNE